MHINLNVEDHTFEGVQKLVYTNNSPDTLHQVFYHLYFNAFQPGSMMDVRSRTIKDSDPRVKDRIFKLKAEEYGKQRVKLLKQDGQSLRFHTEGTILEVTLHQAILPNTSVTFDMEFEGQVPLQVRRSGRDSKEGIDYSMTQWYPKMVEYDEHGWHANPYVGREFHGVWGDFDVKITLDSSYVIGASGYLQNPNEIGYGYEEEGKLNRPKSKELTWHFKAPNVHDFAWAADPDYIHEKLQVKNGPLLHFLYQKSLADTAKTAWQKLPEYTEKGLKMLEESCGKYPYGQYTVIQGGDGGMEYPMITLITGERKLKRLVSVTIHELAHMWYQGILATDEALYAWMDEGFNTYYSDYITNVLMKKENKEIVDPYPKLIKAYIKLATSGKEEPLSTHADHFDFNRAYSIASYVKGAVFLRQLHYILGEEAFKAGMLKYYDLWKFKHPNPTRFKRVMERVSGLELDWFFEYFMNSTKTIDYAIHAIQESDDKTSVVFKRLGKMPMPLDVEVELNNGDKTYYYIPMRLMRGTKPAEANQKNRTVMNDWPWTHPEYTLTIDEELEDIKKISIDPTGRMADIDRENNTYPKEFPKTGDKKLEFKGN